MPQALFPDHVVPGRVVNYIDASGNLIPAKIVAVQNRATGLCVLTTFPLAGGSVSTATVAYDGTRAPNSWHFPGAG